MCMGLLLTAAALFLAVYTLYGEHQAKENANVALTLVSEVISEENSEVVDPTKTGDIDSSSVEEEKIPEFVSNPEIEMPEKSIDGQEYIGVVEIPSLSLELPVISEWSDEKLKISPCRYVGSVYTCDLIISGHSYKNHFRYIRKLEIGDTVIFTDMDGNRFVYEVSGTEVIAGTDVAKMEEGEWDLTLFTCTTTGSSRHTVRCTLVEDENSWMKY